MACFSTCDIDTLFEGACLPDAFADATIEGDLTTGESFVATIGDRKDGDKKDDGDKRDTGIGEGDRKGKGRMHLQVRPNPMNPKADVLFVLSQPGRVRVTVFDLRGRLVATLRDGEFGAGPHAIPWNGMTRTSSRAASGIYYIRVQTPQETVVQAVTVVK
jgi:hypothetical protein